MPQGKRFYLFACSEQEASLSRRLFSALKENIPRAPKIAGDVLGLNDIVR